jgi:hypothetical protein
MPSSWPRMSARAASMMKLTISSISTSLSPSQVMPACSAIRRK